MRIVFMGTPDFAVSSLKVLVENKYNIVAVITAPDKPSGRGQKLRFSAVKTYAMTHELKVLQPSNLKSMEFIEELQSLKPDIQVVVAFRMLPKSVWQLARFGTFNLHASLLPQYRGAAPIHWAIINGETETGVTTFFIDDKIDTGAILLQKAIDISPNETVGELHDRLMLLGSALVKETIDKIAGNELVPSPQPKETSLRSANKLTRDNCKIDWRNETIKIYNKIRGLNPFPAAWCYLNTENKQEMIKLFHSTYELRNHKLEPGDIVTHKDHLKIATTDGFINLHELQLPGKRKMEVKALLNGYTFYPSDHLS
jgi:methionyl-tRNA formyltransferase